MSVATEDFIKRIYQFEKTEGFDTNPGILAKSLKISNAAVTDFAKKLAGKKILIYEKYKKLKLTPTGKKMALNVIRKHRLWETFLFEVFNLSLHEIHREAELLEHQTSDFLAEKISHYLGNPKYDPHGDPIPNKEGVIGFDKDNILLSKTKEGIKYKISRLIGFDKELFEFFKTNNINIGTIILVEKHFMDSNMIEVHIHNTKIILNKDFTNKIYVKEQIKS